MAKTVLGAESTHDAAELQQALDDARLTLLGAVDAARGAEAERAVVEARVKELEHQHHMLTVERDELRRELDRVAAGPGAGGIRLARRVVNGVRRRVFGG